VNHVDGGLRIGHLHNEPLKILVAQKDRNGVRGMVHVPEDALAVVVVKR
jgi:hypothetical protein